METENVNKELKEMAPGIEWPEVNMDVPDDYFRNSREEVIQKIPRHNDQARIRKFFIAASAAAAIVLLMIFTNVIDFADQTKQLEAADWEKAQYYLTEHIYELKAEELAYLLPEAETVDLEVYQLTDEDWENVIQDWTYELDEERIFELRTKN